jgi:Protein of unknown function (DUF3078)
MKKLIIAAGILFSMAGQAQDATIKSIQETGTRDLADDTAHKRGWRKGINMNLGIAQGNTSNWAAGGEQNSFSINTYVNMYAILKDGKHRWMNNLDLFYALINTTSQGVRKNDDRIDFFSKYSYLIRKKWGFGAVMNFRSQFSRGYDYSKTPKELISDFMAPGYLTLAPGINWQVADYASIFVSPISGRWTFVTRPELVAKYGVDPGKKVRTELGAYLTANFKKEIMKNVTLSSRLDLYSNYLQDKPQNIDIFWTNVIIMKVNKFLGVTYNFDLIYDDDVRAFGPTLSSPATQIKSLLSVGITAKL